MRARKGFRKILLEVFHDMFLKLGAWFKSMNFRFLSPPFSPSACTRMANKAFRMAWFWFFHWLKSNLWLLFFFGVQKIVFNKRIGRGTLFQSIYPTKRSHKIWFIWTLPLKVTDFLALTIVLGFIVLGYVISIRAFWFFSKSLNFIFKSFCSDSIFSYFSSSSK